MWWSTSLVLAAVVGLVLLLWPSDPPAPAPAPAPVETTYVILVRSNAPTPSETVTPWLAYEAAPQTARSQAAAIRAFALDSGLSGEMKAVPLDDWTAERRVP